MHPRALKAYNLACDPFSKEIEDNELWLPPGKKSLVQAIVDGIRQRRHILLTGEPGAGKTVVLRAVRRTLSQTKFRLTYCHNATLGRRDFYRQLCRAIGLSTKATAAAASSSAASMTWTMPNPPMVRKVLVIDQTAVTVLLALLNLGVKHIRLRPTLPAFVSPNVLNVLVEKFDIKPIGSVEEDVTAMMACS